MDVDVIEVSNSFNNCYATSDPLTLLITAIDNNLKPPQDSNHVDLTFAIIDLTRLRACRYTLGLRIVSINQ